LPGTLSLSTMSLSGLKSSREDGTPTYLIGSIAIEQSTRAVTEEGFSSGSLGFGEGYAIFGEPDVIAHGGPAEAPMSSADETSSILPPFAMCGASSAMSARSAAGHVYGFLVMLLLMMRAA